MRRRGTALRPLLLAVLLVGGGLVLGRAWLARAMETPTDASNTTATAFLVDRGETAGTIATRLEAQGLIRSGFAFTWQVGKRNLDTSFHVGSFRLSPSMTGTQVLDALTSASPAVRVTIPEGFTVAALAQRLSDAGIADAAAIRACAKDCVFDLPLLSSKPADHELEGYLFPNTYDFLAGAAAEEVVGRLVRELDRRIDAELRAQVAESGRTLHEVLTMASMLEKEVTQPRDRRIVAGILWRRLELGIALGVDATVLYALGEHKDFLTRDELQVDSPYNTRRFRGMPPGPICNPGLDTIRAALEPEATEWLFYLTDERGNVHYARTNAEHEANKARYL